MEGGREGGRERETEERRGGETEGERDRPSSSRPGLSLPLYSRPRRVSLLLEIGPGA